MGDTIRHSLGAKVKYDNDGAGASLVSLTKVISFKPWKDDRRTIPGTHLESTDGYDEIVPEQGLQTTEIATITLHYTEAQYNTLQTLKFAGTEKYWYFQSPLMSGQTTPAQQKGRGMVKSVDIQDVNVNNDTTMVIIVEVARTVAKPLHTAGA